MSASVLDAHGTASLSRASLFRNLNSLSMTPTLKILDCVAIFSSISNIISPGEGYMQISFPALGTCIAAADHVI